MKIETMEVSCHGDKRTYLPFRIHFSCPNCETPHARDLSGPNYLSYPTWNEEFEMDMYCDECDHEWVELMKLTVGLKWIP